MNYGIIDVGSNSIRLVVYKNEVDKISIIYNKRETVGLISYLDKDHLLSNEAVLLLSKVIQKLLNEAKNFRIFKLHIIATEVLRVAQNQSDILLTIKELTGVDIEVISREQEARLGVNGVLNEFNLEDGIVVDIGGGSTKISFIEHKKIKQLNVLPIGSLNSYTEFVKNILITNEEIFQLRSHIKNQLILNPILSKNPYYLYGIGGTFKSVKRLIEDFKGESINLILKSDIKELIHKVTVNYKKYYLNLLRLIPDRMHTIIPGLIILDEILTFYKVGYIKVAKNGIREGYVLNLMQINNVK